jgi:hypothetical protein
LRVLALHEFALTTGHAPVAVAAEPADRDPVADTEALDAFAEFRYRPCDLMSRNHRPGHVWEAAVDDPLVGSTDPAGGDGDPDVVARGRGGVDIGKGERCSCGFHHYGFVRGHGQP